MRIRYEHDTPRRAIRFSHGLLEVSLSVREIRGHVHNVTLKPLLFHALYIINIVYIIQLSLLPFFNIGNLNHFKVIKPTAYLLHFPTLYILGRVKACHDSNVPSICLTGSVVRGYIRSASLTATF